MSLISQTDMQYSILFWLVTNEFVALMLQFISFRELKFQQTPKKPQNIINNYQQATKTLSETSLNLYKKFLSQSGYKN